jgi:hypothetical protein
MMRDGLKVCVIREKAVILCIIYHSIITFGEPSQSVKSPVRVSFMDRHKSGAVFRPGWNSRSALFEFLSDIVF